MQKYGELLRMLLGKRGINDEAAAENFLNPNYTRDLHDPFLMRDMDRACTRLFEAISNNEKVIVYADYDCDGIPGAVVMNDLFKEIKYKNYEVYIPERNSEGYGLNMEAIKQFALSKAGLIITIDLGITAVEEVERAKALGIDVIVTDHHLPQEIIPKAHAILNPKIDNYPEKMLCGAGVVFKFVQGFLKKYGEHFGVDAGTEKWMIDMVGLATLSDMVPLLGENRALSYFGMKVLRKSPRPGLQKLLRKLNIEQKYLSEDDVGFMIVPRINAASRMGSPRKAFELLSTDDPVEAGALTDYLSKINDERKIIVASIMREVGWKLENGDNLEKKEVLVVGSPDWRPGVLGLVAAKLCDKYSRPVFVWGRDENDLIKGSCRSPGPMSLVELMQQSGDHFLEFGGHKLAGGFTVDNAKVHFLEEILNQAFANLKKDLKEEDSLSGNKHDFSTDLSLVSRESWKEIEKLAPFGCENPKPTFLFDGVRIENIKKFGKNGGEHLEIVFSDKKARRAKAISFFSGHDSFGKPLASGVSVNLLATFDLSRFRGREELRLRIEDIY